MGIRGTFAFLINLIAPSSQGLSTFNFPSLWVETSPAGKIPNGLPSLKCSNALFIPATLDFASFLVSKGFTGITYGFKGATL